jgi:hypothetical protein
MLTIANVQKCQPFNDELARVEVPAEDFKRLVSERYALQATGFGDPIDTVV